MKQEKIKEIIRSAHIKSECTDCSPIMIEDLMQEYGQFVRQQTLEEAIGKIKQMDEDSFQWAVIENLQALKDKNYDK